MSIRKSPLFASALAALLFSTAAVAQTAGTAAPDIQKPVPPTAPAVSAPVAAPIAAPSVPAANAAGTPDNASSATPTPAQYQQMRQVHEERFKALTPAEQTHIAVTHERAARRRYDHDTHNLDALTPQQKADMKQELTAWFTSLPLERQADLKRRDEILYRNDESRAEKTAKKKEERKSAAPVVQIVTTPAAPAPEKAPVSAAPAQPAQTAPAATASPAQTAPVTPA
ncbi:MAG: hypothetical protein KGQ70_07715, partial [Alphaproteobacteria bacterium]|nr:hypothetical protein [Alphaproteobacteria bacterium]